MVVKTKKTGKCWKHSPVRIFRMPGKTGKQKLIINKNAQIYEKIS